ncbi:MAG TPA: hypothetical protein VGA78_18410, partial [Gemmatimonadales bacterium]
SPPQLDAVSTADTRPSTLTISHTTGSGSNRLMLVGISFVNDRAETVTSVNYNGVALTSVGTATSVDDARVEIWRLIAPPTGTYNVIITFSAPLRRAATVGVMTFTGVHQTTPLGTFASATGQAPTTEPSVNVTSASGELVFDTVACESCTSLTVGAGQTQRWNLQELSGAPATLGAGSTEAGAASVTMSWTRGSDDHWAIGAVSIKPASGGAISFQSGSQGNTGDNQVGSLTVSHTVSSSGTNKVLVVGVNIYHATSGTMASVASMTYAGQPMTFLATAIDNAAFGSNRIRSELWYIKDPTTGTNDVFMTFDINCRAVAGAITFTGVDQTTPFGSAGTNGGNDTTPTVTLSSAAGELVVDTVGIRNIATNTVTLTAGANQTERYNDRTGIDDTNSVGAGSEEAGAGSVTMSWTSSEARLWAIVAAPLKPAGGSAPTVDATSSGQTQRTGLTISHTTSGTNRLMLVGVTLNNQNSEIVSSVTYNGVGLTQVGSVASATDTRVEIWRLIAPATGTNNVVITFSANVINGAKAGVATFTGVDQTTPLGTFASANGNSAGPATVDVTSATNELVFDTVGCEGDDLGTLCSSLSVGAGQTQRWNLTAAEPGTSGAQTLAAASTEPGAVSVTMSWSISPASAVPWAIGAVPIKPIVSAVNITVSVHHTKTDGTDPQLIVRSTSTTIDSNTANPLTLTIGSGAQQTFTAADPRLLRVLVTVNSLTGGASFILDYDSIADPTNLATPVVTVPEGGAAFLILVPLVPYLMAAIWRRRRLAGGIASLLLGAILAISLAANQVIPTTAAPDVFYLHDTFTGTGIAHQETLTTAQITESSYSLPAVAGGTDQLYLVSVAIYGTGITVSSISGGGLTWTLQKAQCSARIANPRIEVWQAFGSPSSFAATVSLSAAPNRSSAAISRYSGANTTTPTEAAAGSNSNGLNGACTGGTDNANASLALTSSQNISVLYVATHPRNQTITSADVDYTQRAFISNSLSGGGANLYVHDRTLGLAGTDSADHVLNNATDWDMAGLVIMPASSITPAGKYINTTEGTGGSTLTFNAAGQNAYWYVDQTWPTGNDNASIAAGNYALNMYFSALPTNFPQVVATNTSATTTASTSHTVSLASGIQSGDLLIAMLSGYFDSGSTPVDVDWPAGWTEFFEQDATSSTLHLAVAGAYRKADGSEGSTISVTTNLAVLAAHNAYRITGAADPAVQPPEAASIAYILNADSIDPPSL